MIIYSASEAAGVPHVLALHTGTNCDLRSAIKDVVGMLRQAFCNSRIASVSTPDLDPAVATLHEAKPTAVFSAAIVQACRERLREAYRRAWNMPHKRFVLGHAMNLMLRSAADLDLVALLRQLTRETDSLPAVGSGTAASSGGVAVSKGGSSTDEQEGKEQEDGKEEEVEEKETEEEKEKDKDTAETTKQQDEKKKEKQTKTEEVVPMEVAKMVFELVADAWHEYQGPLSIVPPVHIGAASNDDASYVWEVVSKVIHLFSFYSMTEYLTNLILF